MATSNLKLKITTAEWLPDMDLNHDKQIQSLLCYRYTIGQSNVGKLGYFNAESSDCRWRSVSPHP